ncbi:MAG: CvpA family protein [Lachnospiraceae bacterium]|nr:CvpA family protein [Lachnospiraceae bacterium]
MNITFIVALVVIIGLTILGYVRGLIKSVWHLAGAIIIIALTLMLAPTTAKILNGNEKIRSKVYEKVKETIKVPESGIVDQDKIDGKIEDLKLPAAIEEMFKKYVNEKGDSVEKAQKDMVESLYDKATTTVITGCAYVITLIIVIILSAIAVWLLDKFFQLPGLNAVNKIGGLIIGLVEGVIIVWAFCGLISVFAATETGATIIEQIQANPLLNYFYEHNLISTVISAKLMLSAK